MIKKLNWRMHEHRRKVAGCGVYFEIYLLGGGRQGYKITTYVLSYRSREDDGRAHFSSLEAAQDYAQLWHEANIREYLE